MLVGRFFLIVPVLAIAGSLAASSPCRRRPGTFPTTRRCSRSCSLGVVVIVVGLTYFPVVSLGPVAGAPGAVSARDLASIFDPPIVGARARRQLPQARPAPHGAQPGHVRRRGRPVLATFLFLRDSDSARANVFAGLGRRSGCGSPCCSPTSPRRWPRAAARHRRRRSADAGRDDRATPARPTGPSRTCRALELELGDEVVVTAGEVIPADGDVVEGIASVDESAITGESAPSSASPAATAAPSPAVPACSRTRSSSGSRRGRARASSTA